MNYERRGRKNYAEDAKEFRKNSRVFWLFFCVFCETFATSAYGSPLSISPQENP
jgi:hypothetical protein